MAKHIFNASQVPNVTWKTIDDLYAQGGSDCIGLYLKYCYHANIQQTNQVYANLAFMMQGLGWGRDKTKGVRDKLIALGYIALVNKGKTGHYVKINHLITYQKMKPIYDAAITENQPLLENSDKYFKDHNVSKYIKHDDGNPADSQVTISSKSTITGEGTPTGERGNPTRDFSLDDTGIDMSIARQNKLAKLQDAFTAEITDLEVQEMANAMAGTKIKMMDCRKQRIRLLNYYKEKGLIFNSRAHFVSALVRGIKNWGQKIEEGKHRGISFQDPLEQAIYDAKREDRKKSQASSQVGLQEVSIELYKRMEQETNKAMEPYMKYVKQ